MDKILWILINRIHGFVSNHLRVNRYVSLVQVLLKHAMGG